MRPVNPVIIAMVLVVTSFAGSLTYSQYLVQEIDERALAIIQDSVPRFEHITEARRMLLQTATLMDEYISGAAGLPTKDARARLDELLRQLHGELAAYVPLTGWEAQELRSISQDISALQAHTHRAFAQVDAGDFDNALEVYVGYAHPLELHINQIFERLRVLNESRVKSDTQHILGVRRSAVRAATALGLLSLSLAIAATALVLHGQQTRARLVEENARLLSERAAEAESFAGRVAHDLRDPLNAVGLRLAALQQCDLDNHVRGQLEKVRSQLTRMRLVIDGLLEFARSGARPSGGARADLAAVLDEVLIAVRPAAEAAQAELSIGPINAVPLALAPEALSSVLTNLLGNAVKYVGEGKQLPHRIGVRVSQSARLIRIEVEDNGPGLPPGTEDRVFEPFRRLPSHQPGTGLGLATVKRIVEAYQGRVGVNAEPGRGSTFWVEIPCSEAPAPITSTRGDRARQA